MFPGRGGLALDPPAPHGKVLSAEGRVSPSLLQHRWGGWHPEGKVSGQISLENAGLTGFLMQDYSEPLICIAYSVGNFQSFPNGVSHGNAF